MNRIEICLILIVSWFYYLKDLEFSNVAASHKISRGYLGFFYNVDYERSLEVLAFLDPFSPADDNDEFYSQWYF